MGWYQEERAMAFLLALGVQGCPERHHMAMLIDQLGDLLVIEHGCRVPRAKWTPLPGHRGLILMPRGLTADQVDEDAFHEATHFLLKHGAADALREHADLGCARDREMIRTWEDAEEREVEDFLLAFLLPAEVLSLVRRDRDLLEICCCSPELIRIRKERLGGKHYHLQRAPSWSAWSHYQVAIWDSPSRPAVRIRSNRIDGRTFEVGCPPEELDYNQWRANADLIAFTLEEFEGKYRRYQVGAERSGMIPVGEMGVWAERLRRQVAR